ncbi:MAG TPA: oligosaccharide flippase family protein [Steroidobacteraceae bacterium]|nr:oligosaccharide flippase family protein [Steroidobacteraceae bacterium]
MASAQVTGIGPPPVVHDRPRATLRAKFEHAALVLFDQGVVSAVNFLTVVLLARYLPLAEFGVFMVANTILLLLTGLQNALVAQPHNILGAQRAGLEYTRLTAVLGTLQLIGCVLIAIVVAASGLVWQVFNPSYASVAFALALTIPAWMGQEFVRRVLYTQGDVKGAALNNCTSYGLQLAGILCVVLELGTIDATPANAVLALGASSLLATVFGAYQLRHRVGLRALRELPELRSRRALIATLAETWQLSRWLVAQQGVAWLGVSGNGLILAAMLGPASFGAYRAAYQIVNVLNPLRQAATNHLPSKAARHFAAQGHSGLREWNRRLSLMLALPFVVCAALVTIGAEPLARLLYGDRVVLDHLQLWVAMGALAYCLNFARTPLDFTVLIAGGGRSLFLRTLWLNGFVLTAGVALIWRFGIQGALLSEIICASMAGWLTWRIYRALFPTGGATGSIHADRANDQADDTHAGDPHCTSTRTAPGGAQA